MDKKNKKPKRTFIPQSIGDTLRKVNRNFSSKFGKIEFIIHSKWPDIVGSYFKIYSEPKNITRLPDYENDLGETIYKSHLNVNVAPAAALEFQHFKDKIIDKINSFFGFRAIADIRLQQSFITKNKNVEEANPNKKIMSDKVYKKFDKLNIQNIDNKELEKTLEKLKQSINEKDK